MLFHQPKNPSLLTRVIDILVILTCIFSKLHNKIILIEIYININLPDMDLILQIAEVVNLSLDKYFPDDVRIIAEPGRFYVASAFTIATNVIAKRVVARDQQGESMYQFKYRSILFIASNFINSARFDNSFCLLQYSYYEC